MSDGVILENKGFGWKLGPKLKAGIDIRDAYRRAVERQAAHMADRPAYGALRKAMLDACGLCHRWKLYMAIKIMPDDADGVWSEVCDGYGDNPHIDLDDVSRLCDLYRAALAESERLGLAIAA
jgi:hypothetical protein